MAEKQLEPGWKVWRFESGVLNSVEFLKQPLQIAKDVLQVNGFTVDIRGMPIEVQQIAFEKGLIPFIPAERDINNG